MELIIETTPKPLTPEEIIISIRELGFTPDTDMPHLYISTTPTEIILDIHMRGKISKEIHHHVVAISFEMGCINLTKTDQPLSSYQLEEIVGIEISDT